MSRLRTRIHRLAPHFRTVLLRGEAGTGKTVTARILHRQSPGAAGPFVTCNNANSSFASHLEHLLQTAHRGTLFFDRISELPIEAQTHLLHLLRRQSTATPKMDLRMIASTREDLKVLTFAGSFLQELYRELSMVEIVLPPLRERLEDISSLAKHFAGRSARHFEKNIDSIDETAIKRLEMHSWPENVRELQDVLHRAVKQCQGGVLTAGDLPTLVKTEASKSASLDSTVPKRLQDVVEEHVLRVLKLCAGNKLRAAELLGISRSTLYRMLETRSYSERTTPHSSIAKKHSFAE